jgi:hypothetical protein
MASAMLSVASACPSTDLRLFHTIPFQKEIYFAFKNKKKFQNDKPNTQHKLIFHGSLGRPL